MEYNDLLKDLRSIDLSKPRVCLLMKSNEIGDDLIKVYFPDIKEDGGNLGKIMAGILEGIKKKRIDIEFVRLDLYSQESIESFLEKVAAHYIDVDRYAPNRYASNSDSRNKKVEFLKHLYAYFGRGEGGYCAILVDGKEKIRSH